MQKLGEMCITNYSDNTHWAKLANSGAPGIWVGYADGHPTGTYQVFNSKTKNMILTHDMTFLKKSYSQYSKVEKLLFITMSYEGLDDEEELKIVPIFSQNNNNKNNVVGDSDSDSNDKNKSFDEDFDEDVKATPDCYQHKK